MTMYFVPHCTLLTFQILIFSSESLFSNPYLFLSLYFLLYIISVRGVGGGVWGQSPQENFLDVCADDSVYLH